MKRRALQTGIETSGICNHHFRDTVITAHLDNLEAKLEHAQQIAAHSNLKSTRLYDWMSDEVSMD